MSWMEIIPFPKVVLVLSLNRSQFLLLLVRVGIDAFIYSIKESGENGFSSSTSFKKGLLDGIKLCVNNQKVINTGGFLGGY